MENGMENKYWSLFLQDNYLFNSLGIAYCKHS